MACLCIILVQWLYLRICGKFIDWMILRFCHHFWYLLGSYFSCLDHAKDDIYLSTCLFRSRG